MHSHLPNPPDPGVLRRFAGQFRRDFGDIPADFLDFLLSSGPFHVADDGLCGEHGRAQQVDFRFRTGPFVAFQGLHEKLDHELVRRNTPLVRLFFDAFPLFRRDSDVLLYRLNHPFCYPFVKIFRVTVKSGVWPS